MITEIRNGSSVLTENILNKLKKFPNFQIIENAKVHTISDEDRYTVIYVQVIGYAKLF